MGSGVQRVARDLVVICVGYGNDNSIDAFQQVMVVEECAVDLVVGSGGLKLVGVGIGNADEVGPIIGPETGDMSSGRPPSRTDNAHSGSSHQGTPVRFMRCGKDMTRVPRLQLSLWSHWCGATAPA